MNTNFIDKYMALKAEEKDTLNKILEQLPNKEYEFDEDEHVSVDCYIEGEPHHADVKKVVYPISSDGGIFVEDTDTELTEIGYTDMHFGEIEIVIENLPDPSVEILDEQCERILDKVSEATKYDKEELYIQVDYDKDCKPVYSIMYDGGVIDNAGNMSYESVQHYLNGIEFALDMWALED